MYYLATKLGDVWYGVARWGQLVAEEEEIGRTFTGRIEFGGEEARFVEIDLITLNDLEFGYSLLELEVPDNDLMEAERMSLAQSVRNAAEDYRGATGDPTVIFRAIVAGIALDDEVSCELAALELGIGEAVVNLNWGEADKLGRWLMKFISCCRDRSEAEELYDNI